MTREPVPSGGRISGSGLALLCGVLLIAACQAPIEPPVEPPLLRMICVPEKARLGPMPALEPPPSAEMRETVTIYRDRFGVPHVFAPSDAGAFFGFGYAQGQDHLPELLFMILQVQGRLAEAFGAGCVESDRQFRTLGLARRAASGLARVAPGIRRQVLRPFAAGINAYAERASEHLPAWTTAALPVSEADILALHNLFAFALSMVNDPWAYATHTLLAPWGGRPGSGPPTASNAFAVRAARTAAGNAIIAINPHIHLSHPFLMYEARIKGARIDARGTTFYGLPLFIMRHTGRTGWGVTINYADTYDRFYEVVNRRDRWLYLFDNAWRRMTAIDEVIKVKGGADERLTVHETVHGPVVTRLANGDAVVLAWATRGEVGLAEQLYAMNVAANRAEFETALVLRQTPNYSYMFADADDAIAYFHMARVAERAACPVVDGLPIRCPKLAVDFAMDEAVPEEPCPALTDTQGRLKAIPGWTSATLWHGPMPAAAFPREADPASAWLQMANTPPWVAPRPTSIPRCGQPRVIAPCVDKYSYRRNERGVRFTQVLSGTDRLTLEKAAEVYLDAHVTGASYAPEDGAARCADAIAPAKTPAGWRCGYLARLIEAWATLAPTLSKARLTRLAPAIALLERWNGRARRESRAMALFQEYVHALGRPVKTDAKRVQALELAVASLTTRHGRIDPPWGTVHRLVRAPSPLRGGSPADTAMSGTWQFLGALHAAEGPYRPFIGSIERGGARLNPDEDGIVEIAFGSVYMLAVELAPDGPRALSAGVFGASDDPASPHFFDQARELFGKGRLRRAWFGEDEVRAHAARTLRLPVPSD